MNIFSIEEKLRVVFFVLVLCPPFIDKARTPNKWKKPSCTRAWMLRTL